MEFKRAVVPLQRPVAALIDDPELVPKEIRRYFRDVNDHLLRVVERITTFDDLLNSILQARLAQVAIDQNNDMRNVVHIAASGWAGCRDRKSTRLNSVTSRSRMPSSA